MTIILIEKENLQGTLGFFAPAVAPRARVAFGAETEKPGFEVRFPEDSPFPGAKSFPVPAIREVSRSAVLGIYSFHIAQRGQAEPVAYLQLAVEHGGIDRLGFCIAPLLQTGQKSHEVRMQQWAPLGSLKIDFHKSVVNEKARIAIMNEAGTKVRECSLNPDQTHAHVSAQLTGLLSVQLKHHSFLQSGGTKKVDIIAEPP